MKPQEEAQGCLTGESASCCSTTPTDHHTLTTHTTETQRIITKISTCYCERSRAVKQALCGYISIIKHAQLGRMHSLFPPQNKNIY